MTIIEHDFGKRGRDTTRRFSQLMRFDAETAAKVLVDPIPYLERANERMAQLEAALAEAARSAQPSDPPPLQCDMIEIDRADYERLQRCREILETTLRQL